MGKAQVYALAALWGWVWAAFLQFTGLGRYLAKERTWVAVVVGVGVDLALARLVMKRGEWEKVSWVVALSSVGIIVRSLVNERRG